MSRSTGLSPGTRPPATAQAEIFSAVDRLIDRAGSLPALAAHRLALLAARHWRAEGRDVPGPFLVAELRALARLQVARDVLTILAGALDQDAVALKGFAVAELYPETYLRPFGDIDLLVADAPAAQRRLLQAGFRPVATQQPAAFFTRHHHQQPLQWPGRESVRVEIHSRPPWVRWCAPPSCATLLAGSTPTEHDPIRYPAPGPHAVILAAHAWDTLPLRDVSDLLDIELMRTAAGGVDADVEAQRLGVGRLWRTSRSAADALLYEAHAPLSLRIWGRDLTDVRPRSLAEHHLRRLLGPFWERPPRAAGREALAVLGADLRPMDGETWSAKVARVGQGARHPFASVDAHNERLGESARHLRARPPGRDV